MDAVVSLAAGPLLTISKELTCTKSCAIGHDRMFTQGIILERGKPLLANSGQANKKFNVISRGQLLYTSS